MASCLDVTVLLLHGDLIPIRPSAARLATAHDVLDILPAGNLLGLIDSSIMVACCTACPDLPEDTLQDLQRWFAQLCIHVHQKVSQWWQRLSKIL